MSKNDDIDEIEYRPRNRNQGNFSSTWMSLLTFIPFVLVGLLVFIWFFCRIEPGSGEIAVLTRKTGKDLPSGQIIAMEKNQKGIQLDVLSEGRYFYNPYSWDWRLERITDIPSGKMGVLVRQFGKELPPGKIIAEEGEKGIAIDLLRPGKYRINPYAYDILLFDAITIPPGHVGIVTNLVGNDPLFGDESKSRNTFLVSQGEKGVQKGVLDPGTYYLNPFLLSVTDVNLQSQRFDFSGKDAINFLSLDGFNITIEGTIEWAIERDSAAMITVRVGNLEDILNKIILPRARGFSRIEGSKKIAAEYITGVTRQEFQNNLLKHLKDTCEERGVRIISALIRNIVPPEEISGPIREKEIAVQDQKKYEQQIIEAQSAAELAKQDSLAVQNMEKVKQDTTKIKAIIEVDQQQSVAVIDATRNLEVAKIENQAADFKVQSRLAEAQAKRDVLHLSNLANSKVAQSYVEAFGSGWNYANFQFIKNFGPHIDFIFSSEDGSIGKLFDEYSKERP